MEKISFYFHIPFCVKKCSYCSFNSYPLQGFSDKTVEKYFFSIIKEIEYYSDILKNKIITSIYFGGGTPSIVEPKFYSLLFDNLYRYNIADYCEVTLEVNPATLSEEKIKYFDKIGINRISVGCQSFNDKILQYLGRSHSAADALETIKLVKKYYNNFSIDLMFGIPNQTVSDIEYDLEIVSSLMVPHVSCYSLSVEKGTEFFSGNIEEVEETKFFAIYKLINNRLEKIGYSHYEISNFAFPRFESKHNLNYWNHGEYIGIGASAHSFLNNLRRANKANVYKYISSVDLHGNAVEYQENLSERDVVNEFIFLSLRQKEGLNLDSYKRKFGEDFISEFNDLILHLKREGYVKFNSNNIALTLKGFAMSNEIFVRFMR